MTRGTASLLAVGTAVLALAGCSSGDGGAVAEPAATSSAAPAPPPTPTTTPEQTGPVRALFFGDSYVIGGPYAAQEDSMAALAAGQLGWQAQIRGGGGTGFTGTNPEYGLGTFRDQIDDGALDVGPVDWVVIEGGSNDRQTAPEQLTQVAVQTLDVVAAQHPEARLVLVGTFDSTPDDYTDTDPVIAALRAAAEQAGVPYVDAQRWLDGRADLVGPDRDHPLPEGQVVVGDRLAQALRDLGA